MEIRIRASGQVMTEDEFRKSHPNTSFPPVLTTELLNSYGADVVFEGPQASGGTVYQFSMRQGIEQINGKWYTKYVLGPSFSDMVVDGVTVTAAEQEASYKAQKDSEQAKSVRDSRTQKLKDSDWTQVADAPVDKAVWATYRQALRDISSQSTFPWDVQWPTQPE